MPLASWRGGHAVDSRRLKLRREQQNQEQETCEQETFEQETFEQETWMKTLSMKQSLLALIAAAGLLGYAGAAQAQTMQNPSSGPGAGTAAKSQNTRPAESNGALSGALNGDLPGAANSQNTNEKAAKPAPDISRGSEPQ